MSKRTDLLYFGRMLDEARAIERALAKESTEAEFTAHQDLPGANTYRLQTSARMAEKVLPSQRGRMQIEVEVTGKSCHGSDVRAPLYCEPTWRGYRLNNAQIYPGWVTPASKRWIRDGAFRYPAMLGIGQGSSRTRTRSASAWTPASSRR